MLFLNGGLYKDLHAGKSLFLVYRNKTTSLSLDTRNLDRILESEHSKETGLQVSKSCRSPFLGSNVMTALLQLKGSPLSRLSVRTSNRSSPNIQYTRTTCRSQQEDRQYQVLVHCGGSSEQRGVLGGTAEPPALCWPLHPPGEDQ